MADVATKQQTTTLFLSTTVTRTRSHTELTRKLTNLIGKLCCAREHSVQHSKLHRNNWTGTRRRAPRDQLLGPTSPTMDSCTKMKKAMQRPSKYDTRGFPRLSILLLSLPASTALSGSPRRPSLAKVVIFTTSIQVKGMVE
jgi:hypothetical protein